MSGDEVTLPRLFVIHQAPSAAPGIECDCDLYNAQNQNCGTLRCWQWFAAKNL